MKVLMERSERETKIMNERFDGKFRKGNKDNEWKVWWEELKIKQRKGKKALLGRVEKETKESNNERCNRKIRKGKKDNE